MVKYFLKWSLLKEKLHKLENKVPYVKERDIWWASLGENIGSEINGKNALFSRPVIILKKLSKNFFLVAPTTSKPHYGSWYITINYSKIQTFVCLHQIRTIDYRRLSSKIGQLNKLDFNNIKSNFINLYR